MADYYPHGLNNETTLGFVDIDERTARLLVEAKTNPVAREVLDDALEQQGLKTPRRARELRAAAEAIKAMETAMNPAQAGAVGESNDEGVTWCPV